MRRCGRCRRPPRHDDPLAFIQSSGPLAPSFGGVINTANAPTITEQVCRDCLGESPIVHPNGVDVPIPVCGVCRLALREDESATDQRIRLAFEDSGGKIKAGLYACCKECLEHFRPIIHARLLRDGVRDGQGTGWQAVPPLEAFVGEWLC